jgi:asparagine N-glycosylation enzyme membrane subunit Stt3
VAITYVAIVSTYVPFIFAAIRNSKVEEAAQTGEMTVAGFAIGVSLLFFVLLASPFLAGFQNIIGWLIIGFALWEAWKTNQRLPLAIAGPFALAPAAAAGGAAVPPMPTVPPPLPPPDLPPAPAAS